MSSTGCGPTSLLRVPSGEEQGVDRKGPPRVTEGNTHRPSVWIGCPPSAGSVSLCPWTQDFSGVRDLDHHCSQVAGSPSSWTSPSTGTDFRRAHTLPRPGRLYGRVPGDSVWPTTTPPVDDLHGRGASCTGPRGPSFLTRRVRTPHTTQILHEENVLLFVDLKKVSDLELNTT